MKNKTEPTLLNILNLNLIVNIAVAVGFSSHANSTEFTYLKSAGYTCVAKETLKLFPSYDSYIANFTNLGVLEGSEITIVTPDGKFVRGVKKTSDIAFVPESGDLGSTGRPGYFFEKDFGKASAELSIASKDVAGQGYHTETLSCKLSSNPVFEKAQLKKLRCSSLIKMYGEFQKLQFTLVEFENGNSFDILNGFKLTPKNSMTQSLNENLTISKSGKNAVRILGDAAGVTFTTIELDLASGLKKGTLSIITDGKPEVKSQIECQVR